MLSKIKIKYIHSLALKKNRKETGLFVAEGYKIVDELLQHFPCKIIVATSKWLKTNPITGPEIIEVTDEELAKASLLKSPQEVLGIFHQPVYKYDPNLPINNLCLSLDDIQDPGNLGTIIRLCDWFGIEHIFCSQGTVDLYNPKVIQASMGAISRVKVYYCDLIELLKQQSKDIPIYGTFLNGENIYDKDLSQNGLIIMGNEGNGISDKIKSMINEKLYIPNYPLERETSESLNVAVATAIICSEFRRNKLKNS